MVDRDGCEAVIRDHREASCNRVEHDGPRTESLKSCLDARTISTLKTIP
jgi:hypothetical protein